MKNFEKYKRVYDWKKPIARIWSDKEINKAPQWCSVDLRDGNQALVNPMILEEKVEFFEFLVRLGFKDIEIGFPAASNTEFEFTRYLIENNLIPDDVRIQVLTQSREKIIERTFEALKGVKNAIVHLYNSTSELQRRVVFDKSKEEILEIAKFGATMMVQCIKKYPKTNWNFEYSPESFTGTEMDYAIDVINNIVEIWKDEIKSKVIINLPSTVECSTPNIYADQIEYVKLNLKYPDRTCLCVHAHNDRGTAIAASELALLAGAERIEGTLFGNGERTGNADILTLALNLYTLGIDPGLNFENMEEIVENYEKFTKMKVGPRHPWAGELVFTAFSGSHQDAISKGMIYRTKNDSKIWEVPYLPVDPNDLGRKYESIIRINSQSGGGGASHILSNYGYHLPYGLKREFGRFIKNKADLAKRELKSNEVFCFFENEYVNVNFPISVNIISRERNSDFLTITVSIKQGDKHATETASGNGLINALSKILRKIGYEFGLLTYEQESKKESGDLSLAMSYVSIFLNNKTVWGIGVDYDIAKSGINALISAINRGRCFLNF